MSDIELDVRDVEPPGRRSKIHDAFAALDSGETLLVVNDHDTKPLFYEFAAEVEAFDAENYDCTHRGGEEFVATFPKQ